MDKQSADALPIFPSNALRARGFTAAALAISCGLVALVPSGVARGQVAGHHESPLRDVRVLIARDAERVRVRATDPLSVHGSGGVTLGTCADGDWAIVRSDGSRQIRVGSNAWSIPTLTLKARVDQAIELSVYRSGEWTPENMYPGVLHVVLRENGRIDVVNHVDIEQYVACVVANEVWPNFHPEAFRAQAIAARTFVLYQMKRRQNRSHDVSATQGSQVYRGIRADEAGRRADEATKYTRAVVCAWPSPQGDQLFCAYYSAACGGMSQPAEIFGSEGAIEPLAGGVPCDYCEIAPGKAYRWGPVRISKSEVRNRLVSRYPDLTSLGSIASIAATERTAWGRPLRLNITGTTGQSHDMLAERFRLAIGAGVIRSTDCQIRVTSRDVVFESGKGYGHGLGLCQWGMQGQALQGRRAGEILRYYYPGSKLRRVY